MAPGLPCDACVLRRLRNSPGLVAGLRQSSATSPQDAALLGGSKGETKVKTSGVRRPSVLNSEVFWGPFKRRRGAEPIEGAFGEDCLSLASTGVEARRVPQPPS